MARKQVISNMQQEDDARKSLIGMKAEILGEDIKRRQDKAKLRGKVAVGLAGQKETAKQIAQANFMAGLTRFED